MAGKIAFFNFGNQETYHTFKWVTESGCLKPHELIEEAFRRAETLEEGEFEGEDVCIHVRDRLADLLKDKWEDQLDETLPLTFSDMEMMSVGTIWNSTDSAWQPLLALAFAQVDFQVVAEALLLWAGKCPPDQSIPEVI